MRKLKQRKQFDHLLVLAHAQVAVSQQEDDIYILGARV